MPRTASPTPPVARGGPDDSTRASWRRGLPREPERGKGQPDDGGPSADPYAGWLGQRLFERRIVMTRGRLSRDAASRLSAQLLTLDAAGTEPVNLHVDAPDGDIAAVFVLVDALDLMAAPIHLTVLGELGGPPLVLLAAADRRLAHPHARFHLTEPRGELCGTADEVTTQASQQLQLLDALIERLAALTGKPRHEIETDLGTGRYLTTAEAIDYGLVDETPGRAGPGAAG